MSVDSALLKAVDTVLDDEDTNVLLAFKVSKNQASVSVFGRKGRLQSKPRVLAVTGQGSSIAQTLCRTVKILCRHTEIVNLHDNVLTRGSFTVSRNHTWRILYPRFVSVTDVAASASLPHSFCFQIQPSGIRRRRNSTSGSMC